MFGRRGNDKKAADASTDGRQTEKLSQSQPDHLRRIAVVFRGQVQGVGFRWTSLKCARSLGLSGWVRNERDGSVSMELQGKNGQLGSFFTLLNQSYKDFPIHYVIDSKEDIPLVYDEADFTVRM